MERAITSRNLFTDSVRPQPQSFGQLCVEWMYLALAYTFGTGQYRYPRTWYRDVQEANIESLKISIHRKNVAHVKEWRRSTLSVLVDSIDRAVRLTTETGDSFEKTSVKISFVWPRNTRGAVAEQYMWYLNWFFESILVEGVHRPGEMEPFSIPHAFNIFASDIAIGTELGPVTEYYIEFALYRVTTTPPPSIRDMCCEFAARNCPICLEDKPDHVCFGCGHTLCIDCMNKIWNEVDREWYRCPVCRVPFDRHKFYSIRARDCAAEKM